MNNAWQSRYALAALLLAAALLRSGVAWVWRDNLHNDRDAYLALAQELAAGNGFCTPGSSPPVPTAYRPPLYPIVLAVLPAGNRDLALAGLQVLLGTATVWFTVSFARHLGQDARSAMLAGALVAIDPLLVQYTSMAMTETLCTFLVAALLAVALKPVEGVPAVPAGRQVLVGLLFGLGVLCRPTLWAFGALIVAWWLYRAWRDRNSALRIPGSSFSQIWLTLVVAAATTAPWVVRNSLKLGVPILTTTHGGYTLLLGNNPAFYTEVVDQPLGTVWDGSHGPGQEAWINSVYREMEEAGVVTEIDGDRWMSRRAWQYIVDDSRHFAKACVLRILSFWNVVPSGPAAAGVSPGLRYGVGLYYAIVFALALVGLLKAIRTDAARWMPLLLLIVSFAAVHLLYWSNARMRAPVMPPVAVLAASALAERRRAT